MQESNFNVIIDTENYTTVIGESAKVDVGQAISNVQSGKAEIEAAVQDGKAAFNLNATAKTGEFNQNAVAKTLSFDVHAADSINEAKSWAIGEPVEPAEGSAKYWAGRVGGLISRVDTIESKIPSAASSSNQLADKDWVESQEYITGITSSDVTTALGYTPYNSSNPAGYTSNIGTVTSVNNTSPDSSGNVTLIIPDALPSQTGQAGKFLTTNGTNANWADVDALPSQTGHSGDLLTTNGTDASWVDTATIYPVVETYVNGTEWYRVYSDGWVEQGGEYTTAIATNGNVQITLLKPFIDTNYNVQVTGRFESRTDGSSAIAMGAYAESTTLFSIVNDGAVSNNKGAFWQACGYGA